VAGSIIALIGLLLGALLIVQKLFLTTMLPGYASTVCFIVFFGGVQILSIGLASLYIGRILKEVQNRPLYLVRTRHNFESAAGAPWSVISGEEPGVRGQGSAGRG
jgi:dolichol-phosphate mannosyltransferase